MKYKWNSYVLPKNDEIFFYHKVVCKKSNQLIKYSELEELSKSLGINLEYVPWDKNIPNSYTENKIVFSGFQDQKKKNTFSFIKHIRNAFCHLNIFVDDEWCYLRDEYENKNDKKKKKTTMTGKVKYEKLKSLIDNIIKD